SFSVEVTTRIVPRTCASCSPTAQRVNWLGGLANGTPRERGFKCRLQRLLVVETGDPLRGLRANDRSDAELRRLGDAPLRVGDVAERAGQPELAKASKGGFAPLGVACGDASPRLREWLSALRRGDRERDREVGAGLVDADAPGDVDEHVGARRRGAAVAGEHR